jgi:hypothetical protein
MHKPAPLPSGIRRPGKQGASKSPFCVLGGSFASIFNTKFEAKSIARPIIQSFLEVTHNKQRISNISDRCNLQYCGKTIPGSNEPGIQRVASVAVNAQAGGVCL